MVDAERFLTSSGRMAAVTKYFVISGKKVTSQKRVLSQLERLSTVTLDQSYRTTEKPLVDYCGDLKRSTGFNGAEGRGT